MKSEIRSRTILFLLIVISIILHFYNLKGLSLSNDELSAITRAKYDTFLEMIKMGVYIDYHPAGIQIFIFYWIKLFGDGDFLLRIPFVISGIAASWFLYEITKKWLDEFVALLAVTLFISSSLVLQYTQIARMYSTGMFFCLMLVYGWTNYIFHDKNKEYQKFWWIWMIGTVLAIHNHYFSFAFAGVVGLSGILFVQKSDRVKYVAGGIIALITFIPEWSIFMEQMKTGDIGGWLGPPEKTFLWDFFKVVFNDSNYFLGVIVLWLIFGLIFPARFEHVTRWRILSIVWFMFIFLLAYIYSVMGHPVIQYSTLLFGLPFLLIFIVSFTPAFLYNYKRTSLALLLLLGLTTLVSSGFYTQNHFGVFKEIAQDVNEFPANTPCVVNVINPNYFDYYFKKFNSNDKTIIYKMEGPGDYARLIQIVDTIHSENFGYTWSNSIHPYEVIEIIKEKFPILIEKKIYFNATTYLFSKNGNDVTKDSILLEYQNNFDSNFVTTSSDSNYCYSQPYSEVIDHRKEYSSDFKIDLDKISCPDSLYSYVTFTAQVYFEKLPLTAAMVMSFEDSTHAMVYKSVLITDFCSTARKWYKMILCGEIPQRIKPKDHLIVYFYNPAKEKFYIDNFHIVIKTSHNPYKK